MPSIDIDRDAAHQAAQSELDKPIYPKASRGTAVPRMDQRTAVSAVAEERVDTRRMVDHHRAADLAGRRDSGRHPHRAAHHAHQPRRRLPAVRSRPAHRGPASRNRGTLCGRGKLDRSDPAPAARRGPSARGDRRPEPGARSHRQRAGPRRRRRRCRIWPPNYRRRQRHSTTSPTASGPAPRPPTR